MARMVLGSRKRVALIGALALAVAGQEALPPPLNAASTGKPAQPVDVEVDAPRAPKTTEVSTNALSKPQPPDQVLKPKVNVSGLGPEMKKSTNRWKMFSLRKPVNFKEDEASVIRGARTEGGPPVKLFAVDF